MVYQVELPMAILLLTFLLSIRLGISLPYVLLDYEDKLTRERYGQFHCYKYRICTSGPPPVCAYDNVNRHMDIFEDKCTVFKANCEHNKFYHIINMTQCESKKDLETFSNDSLQFMHLNRSFMMNFIKTTTEPTTAPQALRFVPGLVKLVNKFYDYLSSFK